MGELEQHQHPALQQIPWAAVRQLSLQSEKTQHGLAGNHDGKTLRGLFQKCCIDT